MKIFICTMEDPVYTLPFIKQIIEARRQDIVGVAVSNGNRLTIGKQRSRLVYMLSLLLIMGPRYFGRYAFITLSYKAGKLLAGRVPGMTSPSILRYAADLGIPTYDVRSVNDSYFLAELRRIKPDVIINQAQNILKRDFLSIPRLGVLNRHNALLPRNRGRLTPFWVAYRGERQTGVSIHFVEEGIDSGDILVQEQFAVSEQDTFNTIAEQNYSLATKAMLQALSLLESGSFQVIKNDNAAATYNTVPTFREALRYRLYRIGRCFNVRRRVNRSRVRAAEPESA